LLPTWAAARGVARGAAGGATGVSADGGCDLALAPGLVLHRRGAMGLRQRLAMDPARLAGAGHPTGGRRGGGRTAARLRRGAGFALDRGRTAGQTQAMGLADHRITRDAAEERRNLAGGLALAQSLRSVSIRCSVHSIALASLSVIRWMLCPQYFTPQYAEWQGDSV